MGNVQLGKLTDALNGRGFFVVAGGRRGRHFCGKIGGFVGIGDAVSGGDGRRGGRYKDARMSSVARGCIIGELKVPEPPGHIVSLERTGANVSKSFMFDCPAYYMQIYQIPSSPSGC